MSSTRIAEIDAELAILEKEKETLTAQLLAIKQDKWSEDGLRERLRKAILSRYGSIHNIKMAKLILNGVYDDSYHDYDNAVLLLIDGQFNEIKHDIDPQQFAPNHDDQSRFDRSQQVCENVTLKF